MIPPPPPPPPPHPAGDSQDICFSNSGCTGAQISASSARDCCVGTDDGLSYGSPGTCRECIGECSYVTCIDGESSYNKPLYCTMDNEDKELLKF